jgi:hypothetical protein
MSARRRSPSRTRARGATRRRTTRRRATRRRTQKHAVKFDLQVFELSKAGTSLHLEITARGEKIGDLIVGRGSVTWRGGRRHNVKRWRWSKFAEMMDREAYGGA